VLTASKNGAVYLSGSRQITIPDGKLFENVQDVNIYPGFNFEGYPNRDSLVYAKAYGLTDAKTFMRGTLRYKGFSDVLNAFLKLGLLTDVPDPRLEPGTPPVSWREIIRGLVPDAPAFDLLDGVLRRCGLVKPGKEVAARRVGAAFRWLKLTSDEEKVPKAGNLLDALCVVLQDRLKYKPGERDLVVLRHSFKIKERDATAEHEQHSTLVMYGDEHSSAMAKTVGTPAAIAAKLLVDGAIIRRGVVAPLSQDIYLPILNRLRQAGIEWQDTYE